MSRHLLRGFVFVGIGFLCLPQHAARASTLPPASSVACTAIAGIDEVNNVQSCPGDSYSSPVSVSANWPTAGILGSGVAGFASVQVDGNQSVVVIANLTQFNAPAGEAYASATLTYYIQINPNSLPGSGPTGVHIPISYSSGDTITASLFNNIGTNPFDGASTTITIQTAGSPFQAASQYQASPTGVSGAIGTAGFSGTIDLVTGTPYMITLTATAEVDNQVGRDGAQIDPYFSFVNPADASQYEIDFSPGITNGVSATPIPAALPLFAGGLGALGLLGWRRKRNAAALAAA